MTGEWDVRDALMILHEFLSRRGAADEMPRRFDLHSTGRIRPRRLDRLARERVDHVPRYTWVDRREPPAALAKVHPGRWRGIPAGAGRDHAPSRPSGVAPASLV